MSAGRLHGARWAFLVVLVLPALAACGGGQEDASTVFDLDVGHCFDHDSGTGEIVAVEIVDCDEPHRYEVYAGGEMEGDGAYPGTDAVEEAQAQVCLGEEFEAFTGGQAADSSLHIMPLGPTSTSWDDRDDREILCAAFRPGDDGQPQVVTGSLEGVDAR